MNDLPGGDWQAGHLKVSIEFGADRQECYVTVSRQFTRGPVSHDEAGRLVRDIYALADEEDG